MWGQLHRCGCHGKSLLVMQAGKEEASKHNMRVRGITVERKKNCAYMRVCSLQ